MAPVNLRNWERNFVLGGMGEGGGGGVRKAKVSAQRKAKVYKGTKDLYHFGNTVTDRTQRRYENNVSRGGNGMMMIMNSWIDR